MSQKVHGHDFAGSGEVRWATDQGGNSDDDLLAVLEHDEEDSIERFSYFLHGLLWLITGISWLYASVRKMAHVLVNRSPWTPRVAGHPR